MKYLLFYPAFTMVIWTFLIAVSMLFTRIAAMKSKEIRMSYFRVFVAKDGEVPERLLQFSRQFSNLFEVPTLFYAVTAFSTALGLYNDVFLVGLAWAYVGFRIIHSLVHITYNNVRHRVTAFLISNILLILMWLRIMFGYALN